MIDNSWAPPLYQQPLAHGVTLSLHSGTKYLSGHSDTLVGVVAGDCASIERLRPTAELLGACLSPEDAFVVIRGLRTLHLRMERHRTSALALAQRLEQEPSVETVYHPALESSPHHELWRGQFSGSSGLFAFALRGDARAFCDRLRIVQIGVSWGGFESLALAHRVISEAVPGGEPRSDLPAGLVRLSVGLEDPEDLWGDLAQALAQA